MLIIILKNIIIIENYILPKWSEEFVYLNFKVHNLIKFCSSTWFFFCLLSILKHALTFI